MSASLRVDRDGKASLLGHLDFASVALLWPQVQALLGEQQQLEISLSEVNASNSAGLALLLEAKALAKLHQQQLAYTDLPAELLDLAELSNVRELLQS